MKTNYKCTFVCLVFTWGFQRLPVMFSDLTLFTTSPIFRLRIGLGQLTVTSGAFSFYLNLDVIVDMGLLIVPQIF